MTHALMDVATPSDGELSFDCGDMAKEDKEDLEKQAGRITDLKDQVQRFAVETVLDMGRTLTEAQTRFSRRGNGTFIKRCKERCGIEKLQAYHFISVCQAFGECPTV